MVTCASVTPGKLRDHRADIKHSLVDPVQLPHMPNSGCCEFVYLCVRLYVINGRSDHQFNIVIHIGGAPIA
jgi:hypothetical protein